MGSLSKIKESLSVIESVLKIYRLREVYWKYIDYCYFMERLSIMASYWKYIDFCKFKETLLIIEGLLKLYQLLPVYGTFIEY